MNRPHQLSKTIAAIVFSALCLTWVGSPVMASVPLGAPKKGAGEKKDMFGCLQANDYYVANLAAYQADPSQGKDSKSIPEPECMDLARTGPTQISVDLLDRDVRHKETWLRISRSDGQIILESPKTIAKTGVISTQANFGSPGQYELKVLVADPDLRTDPEASALKIPLTVAIPPTQVPPKGGLSSFFVLTAVVVAGAALYLPRLIRA